MGRSILEFLMAQSNRFQREPCCPRCGNSFIFIDATFWVDGQDEASTIPLPVCLNCESETPAKKDLPMSTTALQAFSASE